MLSTGCLLAFCSSQEFDRAFANAADLRAQLRARHRHLSDSVAREDLSILQQRLLLLDKQWDEIKNQTLLREQLIADRLNRWSTFTEKHKELSDWLDRMEAKVTTGREYHIEDLLHKLQNVSENFVNWYLHQIVYVYQSVTRCSVPTCRNTRMKWQRWPMSARRS